MPDLSRFAARLLPARADVAARRLEGRVTAARFVDGAVRGVAAPLLDLTAVPDRRVELATQLLHGERFVVYDEADGFAWGQSQTDGYVGYVPAGGLGAPVDGPPVTALLTHVYPEPSTKARPVAALPFMARVAVEGGAGGFLRVAGGYVPAPHLAPVEGDVVAQAERFLGVPYLWGGRSAAGLDCSALVQLALMAAGVTAPRDSDMQATLLGAPLEAAAPVRRGDLLFWKGHVAIAADGATIIHANAHHMAVAREPLAAAVARIAAAGGAITARRRLAAGDRGWQPPV